MEPGSGIEIRCADARVPTDESNTCYKIAERVLKATHTTARVVIHIEKQLPVQGGLGAASSNAVATMLGLERGLRAELSPQEKLRLAAEVGSDLPLFLIGGTVLGTGRGEQVHPLQDLPAMHLVVVTPPVGVSTPDAFAQWDAAQSARTRRIDQRRHRRYNKRVQSELVCAAEREYSPAGWACIRCSRKWRGPGRDTASRPRPSRDRERLRTRRLS